MKRKSFIYQTWWIGLIPLLVGCVFMSVAVVMQLVPMDGVDLNGVYTESTSAIHNFRLIFLAAFGGSGLMTFLIGLCLVAYPKYQKNKNQNLKAQGIKVSAEVIDFQATALNVNNRSLSKLTCTAKINGTDYIFKSQPLGLNPLPFLKNERVDVYYDLGNMKRYFVDVDGSARDVIEL
ncbi:hypothetical protein FACS1894192_12740 [Bacilli bacterium]|nr:hypothetical protein FACS1894192_12740 [Bacilli bacterium]